MDEGYTPLVAAIAALKAGLSVHPACEDGSKAPWACYDGVDADGKTKQTWLHPPEAPAGVRVIEAWYRTRKGFGLRCGSESGGLECFEFDAWDAYIRFKEAAVECGLGDLIERIEAGYCEETPGGGIHWLYFTDEVRGSTKLAKIPKPTTENPRAAKTLIETKGDNGFIVCAPSCGTVHATGKPYILKRGGFDQITALTGEERDALWDLARSFDQMPRPTVETKTRGRPPTEGPRPGDDFEQRASWKDVLEEAGWTAVYSRGSATYWRRPGKSIGVSASTNHADSGLLYVFSSSTTFESEKSYTKFGAYACLKHGSNYSEAAKTLRGTGYGAARVEATKGSQRKATGTEGPTVHAATKGEDQANHEEGPSNDVVDRWPTIHPAAFHGIAGEIVRAADPHTEADPIAVLIHLLVGFASAVGRGPFWVVSGTKHYMVLFAALVGATASARKGTSWDVAKFFLSHLDPHWMSRRTKKGMTSGEGVIYHVRDKVTKLNAEGDEVEVDPGEPDKRMFLIESELSRAFKCMNRDSSTLSDVLRQTWDCDETLQTLTKNSTNVASFPHISVIGHITGEELKNVLSTNDAANGLGNRFLWICARRSKELPSGGDLFSENFTPLINRLKEAFYQARGFCRMRRDDDAGRMWDAVYGDMTGGRPGLLGKMLARAEAQTARIACVYAMLDGSELVKAEHMEAALALWEYAEASARFVFGESLGDAKAEKLLEALREEDEGLTRTQISRDVFGGNMKKEQLAELLERLLSLGLIHRTTRDEGKPGPSAELWFAGRAFRVRK